MAVDKPCISELYESGGLDMGLVGKIAHNELDKRIALLPDSEHALASEYIDAYIDVILGLAIARGAESHASADIEYFNDEFSSRAIIEFDELSLPALRFGFKNADDFSLAGVNPDRKYPIGFVSVKDVADTVNELGNDQMKDTLKPADMERVASNLAEAEQCIERYELADGITFNAELEVEKIDLKQGEQGLDAICDAKSEEADLVADGSAVEYGAASSEQSK